MELGNIKTLIETHQWIVHTVKLLRVNDEEMAADELQNASRTLEQAIHRLARNDS